VEKEPRPPVEMSEEQEKFIEQKILEILEKKKNEINNNHQRIETNQSISQNSQQVISNIASST
jgi:hypothetical protein